MLGTCCQCLFNVVKLSKSFHVSITSLLHKNYTNLVKRNRLVAVATTLQHILCNVQNVCLWSNIAGNKFVLNTNFVLYCALKTNLCKGCYICKCTVRFFFLQCLDFLIIQVNHYILLYCLQVVNSFFAKNVTFCKLKSLVVQLFLILSYELCKKCNYLLPRT